jgi:general secretion pathway protein C
MTLIGRLRRNFAWLLAPPIGLVALQTGQAVGELALANLGLGSSYGALAGAFPRTPSAPPPFHTTSAASILARNPFDSQARATAPPSGEPDADLAIAPPCEQVTVRAIAASADPDWSLAALVTGADPRALLRRRDGHVGDLRVELITWDRVWLSGPRGLCQAAMFGPRTDSAAPERTTARPVVSSGAAVEPWISQGIETVSPTEHRIDRGLVPRILQEQASLLHGVHVAPELVGGKVVGARLLGVTPDSLLGKLGIANGDRLETINGYPLTSTESALEAYARLQQAERLTLQVNRGGSSVLLQLDIR